MIELTFSAFLHGDYEDQGYELYLVRDAEQIMYIGISSVSVWDRWFSNLGSHMLVLPNGRLRGNSIIGEAIARRLPDSLDWKIELWTKEDCINALQDEISSLGFRFPENMSLYDLEALLIKKLAPYYNATHRGAAQQDPFISKVLDEAYRKIFEKE